MGILRNMIKSPMVTLIFILVYLAIELVFNYRLVSVAVDPFPTKIDFDNVEVLGRTISAFGVCLFVWSIVCSRLESLKYVVAFILFWLPVVWLTVFIGQKSLIDAYVDSSGNDQKHRAYLSMKARDFSLYTNELWPIKPNSLVEQAMLPSLLYFGYPDNGTVKSYLDIVINKAGSLSGELHINASFLYPRKMFRQYLAQRESLVDAYDKYSSFEKEYSGRVEGIEETYNKGRDLIENTWHGVENSWSRVVKLKREIRTKAVDLITNKGRDLDFVASGYYACKGKIKCQSRYESYYDKGVKGTVLAGTKLKHWVDGNGHPPSIHTDKAYYIDRVEYVIAMSKFGEASLPENYSEYIKSSKVQGGLTKVANVLRLPIPKGDWTKNSFYFANKALIEKQKTRSLSELQKKVGYKVIKPLTFNAFLSSNKLDLNNTDTDYSAYANGSFDGFMSNGRSSMAKNNGRFLFEQLKTLDSNNEWDSELMLAAKSSLRSVLVVFIAMTLSSLLILIMTIRFISLYLRLFGILKTPKDEILFQVLFLGCLVLVLILINILSTGSADGAASSIYALLSGVQFLGDRLDMYLGSGLFL